MFDPMISELEFRRKSEHGTELPDGEMRLLTKLPADELAWYCNILALMGELLIATGTKLKESAHPAPTSFQETL